MKAKKNATRNEEENEIKTRTDKVQDFGHVFSSFWEPFGEILRSRNDAKIIGKKRLKLRAPKGKPRGQQS